MSRSTYKSGEYKTLEELNTELLELKMHIAFKEKEDHDIEQLITTCDVADPELEQAADAITPRILKLIDREFRKSQLKHFATKTLPLAGRGVAAVLLVFFIGLSTAIATVQSVRVSVLNFIISIEEHYTSLGFEETDETIDVPIEWEGYYYPGFIPARFTFVCVDNECAQYTDQEGKSLRFSENTSGVYSNIDTENANVSYISLHGTRAMVVEKRGYSTVVWAGDNRYFIISLFGTAEEAQQVAKSVRMIK